MIGFEQFCNLYNEMVKSVLNLPYMVLRGHVIVCLGHMTCSSDAGPNKQLNLFINTIIKSLSPSTIQNVLSQLDSGHTTHQIASSTVVSIVNIILLCAKHCPTLKKSLGGCPSKLSDADI